MALERGRLQERSIKPLRTCMKTRNFQAGMSFWRGNASSRGTKAQGLEADGLPLHDALFGHHNDSGGSQ